MNRIYKYLALPVLLLACSNNHSEDQIAKYSERVEPILAGDIYPSTFQIFDEGVVVGYQVNIVASSSLTDTISCTINVIDENNDTVPCHLMGGGIEEFENREFTMFNGLGRMIHLFVQDPEKLNSIQLTTSDSDKIILFKKGDSIGVAGNHIEPDIFEYK
jgi:hypothetical protein